MDPRTRQMVRDYWPAALVAFALVGPMIVDPVLITELFLALTIVGLLVAAAVSAVTSRELHLHLPLIVTLAVFTGYLGIRAIFTPEPLIALFGSYTTDGTVLTFVAVSVATLGLVGWGARQAAPDAPRMPLTMLIMVVALYAAASGIAAWEWGSTDPSGGPPNGFTPNSQYQLQLLTVGLGAAIAWGLRHRESLGHVAAAAVTTVVIAANIIECRSSVALPALGLAALVVGILGLAVRARRTRLFAALATGAVGLAGVVAGTILALPATSADAAAFFDRLGNGRGTLWHSAVEILSANPLFGRGLGHASAVSEWRLAGPEFQRIATSDPHNLFFLLLLGGGLLGAVLGLAALYQLLRTIGDATAGASPGDRPWMLAIIGGASALFVLAQFAFIFPTAWVLAALLLGAVVARGLRAVPVRPRTPSLTGAQLVVGVLVVALVWALWVVLPNRAEATRVWAQTSAWNRGGAIEGYLRAVERSWDLAAFEAGCNEYAFLLVNDPTTATPYSGLLGERRAIVIGNRSWDARLAVADLYRWSAEARSGRADLVELRAIVEDGISADPASGLWATAGCVFASRHGDEELAAELASRVRGDASWSLQADASADAESLAIIDRLAR